MGAQTIFEIVAAWAWVAGIVAYIGMELVMKFKTFEEPTENE